MSSYTGTTSIAELEETGRKRKGKRVTSVTRPFVISCIAHGRRHLDSGASTHWTYNARKALRHASVHKAPAKGGCETRLSVHWGRKRFDQSQNLQKAKISSSYYPQLLLGRFKSFLSAEAGRVSWNGVQLGTLGFQHRGSISPMEKPLWISSAQLCLPCCPLHRASTHTGQEEKENGTDSAKNCEVAKSREVLSLMKTQLLSDASCSLEAFAGAMWKGVKGSKPAEGIRSIGTSLTHQFESDFNYRLGVLSAVLSLSERLTVLISLMSHLSDTTRWDQRSEIWVFSAPWVFSALSPVVCLDFPPLSSALVTCLPLWFLCCMSLQLRSQFGNLFLPVQEFTYGSHRAQICPYNCFFHSRLLS